MTWATATADGIILTVRVVPRASRTEVQGVHGDALKIRLQAPPVEGKANRALVDFLADALGVSRSSVEILTGDTSRNKRVLIRGINHQQAEALLPPGKSG
jgi:uncharacterized protein (TIGR00251 family)